MSGFVFTLPPRDSTKDVYTSEITFLALHPCTCVSFGVVQKPITLSTEKFK